MSPTARSLQRLRKAGATAEVVERWNPHARVRHDLFGFIDVLAIEPERLGCLGVQATTSGNLAHRWAKLHEPKVSERIASWLKAGNRLELHGWSKRGPRGKRKVWDVRVETVARVDVTAGPAKAAR